MPASIDISRENVLTSVVLYLQNILPSACEVVVGQVNRVPEPTSPDFVTVTPLLLAGISTPVTTYLDSGAYGTGRQLTQSFLKLTFQLDFHGPNSGDNSTIFYTLFRSPFTCDFFDNNVFIQGELSDGTNGAIDTGAGTPIAITSGVPVAPLYATEPRQSPFVNGESEIEETWSSDAEIEYNPTVATGQDFFVNINVVLKQVDATFPP